jgi:hypothetical protein
MTDKISIYDHSTGELIERDMTDAEQKQRDAEGAAHAKVQEEAKATAEALRATKIAAYQKLGLNADEIEALLPTPKPIKH